MKFGKSLSNQIEQTLPEWRDKFLSYKELKKRLKLIKPVPAVADDARASKRARIDGGDCVVEVMSKEEADFVNLLEDELEKFNSFFVEKEEEYIIRLKEPTSTTIYLRNLTFDKAHAIRNISHRRPGFSCIPVKEELEPNGPVHVHKDAIDELQDSVAKANDSSEEMIEIRKEIVDFHGEMVLLENYSSLNYTGLVKILKKYDKRTGALLRLPFIQKVLQQPFYTTDLLYKLVKECEALLDRLFALTEIPASTERADEDEPSTSTETVKEDGIVKSLKELAEIEYMKSLYMKSTISALRVLKEIRSGSSTVSAFSLPPLQVSAVEETWTKIPLFEQLAK